MDQETRIETAYHRLRGMAQALSSLSSADHFRDFSDMFAMFSAECDSICDLLEINQETQ